MESVGTPLGLVYFQQGLASWQFSVTAPEPWPWTMVTLPGRLVSSMGTLKIARIGEFRGTPKGTLSSVIPELVEKDSTTTEPADVSDVKPDGTMALAAGQPDGINCP